MDLNKSRDFFNPNKVEETCHIIGCGSIGSNVAELLARYGIEKITLWDFDKVEPHNIANQLFTAKQINLPKVEALKEILQDINPANNKITIHEKPYKQEPINGFVFICVDSIEVRKQIVEHNKYNSMIKAMFDFRTSLLNGQCYAADWSKREDIENLLKTMQFSHEEALKNTPVSACGFELSVAPVVRFTAQLGIINFTNFINKEKLSRLILTEPYNYALQAL